jgi:alpha(1,3/1,4) fucosyltransferase
MKKPIKIKFVDFWPTLNRRDHCSDHYFLNLLRQRFTVEICDDPDILFFSVFGSEHKKYNCFKIFFTGENVRPDFHNCNFAFSFDHLNQENHYRLPVYALYLENPNMLLKQNIDINEVLRRKTKFCNFIYSNGYAQERIDFFTRLSKYKHIDSAGSVLNNMGKVLWGYENEKLKFMQNYKFTIAFENSSYPGYTTEKLIHPMLVKSIPIYWGNELVHLDFNTESFLNYYDYKNEDELVERIIEVDLNDNLYKEYLLESYYNNNKINQYINPENILNQIEKILKEI